MRESDGRARLTESETDGRVQESIQVTELWMYTRPFFNWKKAMSTLLVWYKPHTKLDYMSIEFFNKSRLPYYRVTKEGHFSN